MEKRYTLQEALAIASEILRHIQHDADLERLEREFETLTPKEKKTRFPQINIE